ncbi:MAG: aminodeoxychorismate/anthranilate synthase component II [Bacteroidota bacterium]
MKVFLLDNYDSFTYMLKDYIEQCGVECIVKRNDDESIIEHSLDEYDAIIISPGPKIPSESGNLMNIISTYHQQKPILGVCLGHQGIGEFFGAKLIKSQIPRHGKVDLIHHNHHELFEEIINGIEVTRYHSLVLEEVTSPLEVIAWSERNEIMAVAHKELPIYGIQFHPESYMTKSGIKLIKNFFKLSKQLA